MITAAGFLPIATAASSTGEYTRSIFQVVTIALVVSWFAAVLFVPYLGDKLLPDFNKDLVQKAPWYQRLWARLRKQPEPQPMVHHAGEHHDPYQSPFYQRFPWLGRYLCDLSQNGDCRDGWHFCVIDFNV